jgi:ent-kaurene oxidase
MKFDALRFYKMRERSAADSNLHQFASIPSDASMAPFGFGRSACPGRFFASQQIKVLLAYLIMNYDLRVYDEHGAGRGRPQNLEIGLAIVPDPKALIEFKQRTGE